ncbi:MAG: phosphatase PAP2 family protein [Acidimicrobiales bacterium]
MGVSPPGRELRSASGAFAVDRRWYLDVNRFATRTAWAHGAMAFFARPSALVILAVLLLIGLARARVAGFGGTDLDKIAALVWVAVGTALAYAVSLPVVHLVGRARPFVAMPQAVVLVTRPTGFSFPNEHAVIAGAFAAGLWLSRARLMAAVATLIAIVLALAVVYAGTAYPGDAAAGLLLGTLVSLAIYPFAIGSLRAILHSVARSPLKLLVGGGHHARPAGPGPAARPELVGESGAVRILPPDEARTVRILPPDQTRTVRILPPDETRTVRILPPDEASTVPVLPPDETGTGSGASTAPEAT